MKLALGLFLFTAAAGANTLKPSSPLTRGDVCGSIVKVGDLEDGRNSVMLKTEGGEDLKIYVESGHLAISAELGRATQALASDLVYCARVKDLSGQTAYLVDSSIQKK